MLVDDSWEIVHDSNVHKLVCSVDDIEEGLQVRGSMTRTERWRGGLGDQNIHIEYIEHAI